MSSSSSVKKTIYLIRHAESEENRRLYALRDAAKDLFYSWRLPRYADVSAASELVNIAAQVDSPVSEFGRAQISFMSKVLLDKQKSAVLDRIEMVAHSPLQRAKDTCFGMLGCLAPETVNHSIQRVVELESLKEKTIPEWVNTSGFVQRLSELELWLSEQPESCIALVGHSQYFKKMLQMDYLIGNCDVIEVTFDPAASSCKWSAIQDVHLCRITKKQDTSESTEGQSGQA